MSLLDNAKLLRRNLTDAERSLTQWILQHGTVDPTSFLAQLDHAKVSATCPCGCASVDFLIGNEPSDKTADMTILGDFLFGSDESLCGVFVFAKAGILAGLEVYQLGSILPTQLPKPEDLKPFET